MLNCVKYRAAREKVELSAALQHVYKKSFFIWTARYAIRKVFFVDCMQSSCKVKFTSNKKKKKLIFFPNRLLVTFGQKFFLPPTCTSYARARCENDHFWWWLELAYFWSKLFFCVILMKIYVVNKFFIILLWRHNIMRSNQSINHLNQKKKTDYYATCSEWFPQYVTRLDRSVSLNVLVSSSLWRHVKCVPIKTDDKSITCFYCVLRAGVGSKSFDLSHITEERESSSFLWTTPYAKLSYI